MQMKQSRFNIVVPDDKDLMHLVYNAFTGSISRVNKPLLETLNNGLTKLDTSCSSLFAELNAQGLIVPDSMDELLEYELMHEHWKKGLENVEFNALLTYDCNFECPYCYEGRGEKGDKIHGFKSMTPKMLNSLTAFIKKTTLERNSKKVELVLYGGEPFLPEARKMGRQLTDQIAAWSKQNGLSFGLHVLSNGSLMSDADIGWLSSYSARLQIPIDGDPQMHDTYRYYKDTKKGSFEDIAKVLRMTKGTNVETHIRISLTDQTYPTMENLLDELGTRGLNHVYPDFCYITAFTEACLDFKEHTLSDKKLFKIMPELWRSANKRGFPLDIRPKVQPLPCSSVADGSYIVDPFGDVYKCWELVGLKEHVVGHIDEAGGLQKTQVYDAVLERNPTKIKQCSEHNYLPSCGGGCVCKAQWQNKTYNAPGCGTERFLLTDKLAVYVETLHKSNNNLIQENNLRFEKIEGRQRPVMSHCYVLV
jgi:uncharacterized protein